MSHRFSVIYGSNRPNRQGERAARFAIAQLEARGHSADFIDTREYRLPLFEKRYSEYEAQEMPAALEKVAGLLSRADGFVFIAGEYNGIMQPALKNLIDHFTAHWERKPAGVVTYSAGIFGGVRAGLSVRVALSALGCCVIPKTHPVPRVTQAYDAEGHPLDENQPGYFARFLDELEWYTAALDAARAADPAATR